MNFEKRTTELGTIAILTDTTVLIEDAGDFLDVIGTGASDILVLKRDHLTPGFFDLKTGILGEILQKVSNYRKRLIVLGDFGNLPPGPFADFIRESNRGGTVVFAPNTEAGLEKLR